MNLNLYFDNAATAFPRAAKASTEMLRYMQEAGGSYGRSSHGRSLNAAKIIEHTRELLATKINAANADNIAYTQNATQAINTVLYALLKENDHVLVSALEHNAVMRPLYDLSRRRNIKFKVLPFHEDGLINTAELPEFLTADTALIIINHMSNVNGLIQPIEQISRIIRSAGHHIPILLDCAQSLGHTEVNLQKMPVDYIAITGHKGLLGPTGTGALYCKDPEKMTPLIQGGTGSKSDSFAMPDEMPDMLEAGTPNIAGIFGLNGALCTETKPGHSREQFRQLLLELRKLPRLELYTATDFNNQGPVFSLRHKNHDSSTLGLYLQENFGLETRIGLHCAPLAHQSLKTFPGGTVRFSLSVFHRQIELEYLRNALTEADKL